MKKDGDKLIDTVCFITPKIPKLYINKIREKLKFYICYDNKLMMTVYEFSTGIVPGSYDSSINIKVNSDNTLKITCSIHKIILGYNIAFGSDNLILLANCLKKILYKNLDVKLPDVLEWELVRIDYTLTFNLGNQENVESYINSLNNVTYARRETQSKDNQGVWLAGAITNIKFYNKQREFIKHDFKKIKKTVGLEKANELIDLSQGLLRVEVSIFSRMIKRIFKKTKYRKNLYKQYRAAVNQYGIKHPFVQAFEGLFKKNKVLLSDFKIDEIKKLWESEVLKVIKDKNDVILVNKDNLVLEKLLKNFNTRKANGLYSFWTLLSTRGELYTKNLYKRPTFYNYRKALIECGISWKDTNIYINTDEKVISFVPALDSPFLYKYNEPNEEFKEKVYQLLRGA